MAISQNVEQLNYKLEYQATEAWQVFLSHLYKFTSSTAYLLAKLSNKQSRLEGEVTGYEHKGYKQQEGKKFSLIQGFKNGSCHFCN